jgi:hypothetical protein
LIAKADYIVEGEWGIPGDPPTEFAEFLASDVEAHHGGNTALREE